MTTISPRHISAVIAEELCAVTTRAAELAEREMIAQGHGAPPAPYVLLVLGSGGRGRSSDPARERRTLIRT
ncbi:MAG: hypothetical protein IIB89_05430, partial [Chloroflexi bacterium]|nr:hypothetical protein [Chloroflexota bacterium]